MTQSPAPCGQGPPHPAPWAADPAPRRPPPSLPPGGQKRQVNGTTSEREGLGGPADRPPLSPQGASAVLAQAQPCLRRPLRGDTPRGAGPSAGQQRPAGGPGGLTGHRDAGALQPAGDTGGGARRRDPPSPAGSDGIPRPPPPGAAQCPAPPRRPFTTWAPHVSTRRRPTLCLSCCTARLLTHLRRRQAARGHLFPPREALPAGTLSFPDSLPPPPGHTDRRTRPCSLGHPHTQACGFRARVSAQLRPLVGVPCCPPPGAAPGAPGRGTTRCASMVLTAGDCPVSAGHCSPSYGKHTCHLPVFSGGFCSICRSSVWTPVY